MTSIQRLLPLLLLAGCSVASSLGTTPGAARSPGTPIASSGGDSALPGGDLNTTRGEPCSAARNHCLRDAAWFVGDPFSEEGARAGRIYGARVVFDRGGTWTTWTTSLEAKPGPAYRTVTATSQPPAAGGLVIYYDDRYFDVPDTEHTAHFSAHWKIGYATAADADSVQVGRDDVPLERARVVVETR